MDGWMMDDGEQATMEGGERVKLQHTHMHSYLRNAHYALQHHAHVTYTHAQTTSIIVIEWGMCMVRLQPHYNNHTLTKTIAHILDSIGSSLATRSSLDACALAVDSIASSGTVNATSPSPIASFAFNPFPSLPKEASSSLPCLIPFLFAHFINAPNAFASVFPTWWCYIYIVQFISTDG